MAMVEGNWYAGIGFIDNNNNVADMSFRLPAALTSAQATAVMNLIVAALTPLSDAKIYSTTVSKTWLNDSTAAAPASSEVERKLSLTFSDVTGVQKCSLQVPSPVFTIEQFGTDAVDPTNALVAAFVNAVTNGGLGAGNGVVALGGADLVKLFSAPRIIHRHRSGRK